MKNLKAKIVVVFFLLLVSSVTKLTAQQITKFAVVDTDRVYRTYFRDTSPVRNYETKAAEYQSKINSLTGELQNLHDKQLEYEENGDETNAVKIEAQITKKADFLTEYTSTKRAELESLKKSLIDNDSFYKKLQSVLAKIAESGGYSMVLNLQEDNAILWYSPSVDITDQVITELGL